jgi:hypothetical protein
MPISDKALEEFKAIYKKEHGKEINDADAREEAENLLNFARTVLNIHERDMRRKEKLKDSPKGFHLDEGEGVYSCRICRDSISGKKAWYDKNGIKCLLCQRALDKKVIPVSACKDKKSWYAFWELQSKFNIHPQTGYKMIREGKLKARVIRNENNQPHEYIFLKKENPNLEIPRANKSEK